MESWEAFEYKIMIQSYFHFKTCCLKSNKQSIPYQAVICSFLSPKNTCSPSQHGNSPSNTAHKRGNNLGTYLYQSFFLFLDDPFYFYLFPWLNSLLEHVILHSTLSELSELSEFCSNNKLIWSHICITVSFMHKALIR